MESNAIARACMALAQNDLETALALVRGDDEFSTARTAPAPAPPRKRTKTFKRNARRRRAYKRMRAELRELRGDTTAQTLAAPAAPVPDCCAGKFFHVSGCAALQAVTS